MGSTASALIHSYATMIKNHRCKIEEIPSEYRSEVVSYLNNKIIHQSSIKNVSSEEKKGPITLNPLNLIVESGIKKIISYSNIFTSIKPANVSYELISFDPMISFIEQPSIIISTGNDQSLIVNYEGKSASNYNNTNSDITVRVCVHSLEYEDSNLMLYLKV